MASRTSAQPSQQSLALTLTLDRVAHMKCCHCYLRSLHKTEKHYRYPWGVSGIRVSSTGAHETGQTPSLSKNGAPRHY